MVIYKDKERGTYFFVVRVRQFDGTQKQVKRRGFKTKKEAREAEAKMLVEKETNSSLTFAQVADSYFAWYCQRRKESSIVTIRNVIYNHLLPEFGRVKIDYLTPKHVMLYQNKIINKYSAKHLKKFTQFFPLSSILQSNLMVYHKTQRESQETLKKNPIKG